MVFLHSCHLLVAKGEAGERGAPFVTEVPFYQQKIDRKNRED